MVVTRFNPTTNGKLHLGHLFTLLVNEHFAHSRGGKFYIRFDDQNTIVSRLPKREVDAIIHSQLEDIDWLDIQVEKVIWQSKILEDVRQELTKLNYSFPREVQEGNHKLPLTIRMGTSWIAYPYVCQQTAERVIMDNWLGVTHLIRGDDFLTEYSLYCYFCQMFGFSTPEFIFLPRLSSIGGDISKTNGGFKIADYRDLGYTSDQLKSMMADACLIYPNNGWELYNIKKEPKIHT